MPLNFCLSWGIIRKAMANKHIKADLYRKDMLLEATNQDKKLF